MRILLTAAILAGVLLPAPAPAQGPTAAVTLYGSGCRDFTNSVPAPVLTVSGLPQLGAQITVRYFGPNGQGRFPFLITGLSRATFPIPRLTHDMSASCTLLVTPDVAVFFMPGAGLNFQDRLTYTIPNVGALLGQSVFHQYGTLVLDLFGGASQLDYVLLSNAAQIYVGL